MKLFFDANLSPKLVKRLADLFPSSTHLFDEGHPHDEEDDKIWHYAKANDFTIVTTDGDFPAIAKRRGCPPKIIWLQSCDFPTQTALRLLRRNAIRIAVFATGDDCVLILRNE